MYSSFEILNTSKSTRYLSHLRNVWSEPSLNKTPEGRYLKSKLFLSIQTTDELLHWLGITRDECHLLLNKPDYKQFTIPKNNGGRRVILAPPDALKRLQRQLNEVLQEWYRLFQPKSSTGYTRKYGNSRSSSILSNAKPHIGRNYVMGMDLENFFPGITVRMVKNLLCGPIFQFNEEIGKLLSLLLSWEGHLPVGAPTSPIISNFICLEMDNILEAYCMENGYNYTRYADDLSFSSDIYFDAERIEAIRQVVVSQGFTLNQKKFRIQSMNKRQVVTGLTVNQKVNVDRHRLKKVRAMLHSLETMGLEGATNLHLKFPPIIKEQDKVRFIRQLKGQIAFIGQVRGGEDSLYLKMRGQLGAALGVR